MNHVMTMTEVKRSMRLRTRGGSVQCNSVRLCRLGRCARILRLALLSVMIATGVSCGARAGIAAAAPATSVKVTLTPPTIVADGKSTTTAAAAVTDAQGHPVTGQVVTFSSTDPGQAGSIRASETSGGIYTATITATTTVGRSTITATDSTAKLSGTATLTQTAGPPTTITVTLTPSTIVADGHSTTTAAALVTDAHGHAVSGQAVTFSSTDPGQPASIPAGETSPGMYTATITSTTTLGQSTISARDKTAGVSGAARLTQTAARAFHITVTLTPASVVADGRSDSTAVATVTDAQGHPVSGDTVAFSTSDPGVRFSPMSAAGGTYTATLTSSTVAGRVAVAATDQNTGVSAQTVLTQVHGPASSVVITLSPAIVVANGMATSRATILVDDANRNPVTGDRINVSVSVKGVRVGRVAERQPGIYSVVLMSSSVPATATVTATDVSGSPPVSGRAALTELPAPSLVTLATMQWSFYYTPRYTLVRTLALTGTLRGGTTIMMECHGRGCPFGTRKVTAPDHCATKAKTRGCRAAVTYDLARSLRGHRLGVGARVVINLVRRGWIGKYYAFRIRSGRGPQLQISCLAPGGTKPGIGC